MSHRLCLFLFLFAIASCSPSAPQPSSGAGQASPPTKGAPFEFPIIHGATREAVLASACAWAKDHYRAPQRASADTAVIYHSTTGMLSDGRPETMGLTMERGVAAGLGFRESFVPV